MRKEIEKIYYNLHILMDDYQDLPETKESDDKFGEYIREHIGVGKRMEMEIDDLLGECKAKYEKQGFIYGFEYVVRLLTCQEGGTV